MDLNEISKYLCFILRHAPESVGVTMDSHGWVSIDELIEKVNAKGKCVLNEGLISLLQATDEKSRYEIKEGKIRCVQGHSIPWVEPDIMYQEPPELLYHGTNSSAATKIIDSGCISRMKRHHVHMSADPQVAWKSACRWSSGMPTVMVIKAHKMYEDGKSLGKTSNDVWCVDKVPTKYVYQVISDEKEIYKMISEYKKGAMKNESNKNVIGQT